MELTENPEWEFSDQSYQEQMDLGREHVVQLHALPKPVRLFSRVKSKPTCFKSGALDPMVTHNRQNVGASHKHAKPSSACYKMGEMLSQYWDGR